jgi:hypothetical protein
VRNKAEYSLPAMKEICSPHGFRNRFQTAWDYLERAHEFRDLASVAALADFVEEMTLRGGRSRLLPFE